MAERLAKTGRAVHPWFRKLYASVKQAYLPVDSTKRQDLLAKLAGYLHLVGDTEDREAKNFFWVICLLYLNKDRTSRWNDATDLFPAKREVLVQFTELIRGYERIAVKTNKQSLDSGNINLTDVVYYGLKVCGQREAFLEAIQESWYTYPSKLFSETLIREAARTHRGAFGDFQDTDYDEQLDKVEEIE